MAALTRLLAKSTKTPEKPRRGESLPGHAAEVCLAANALLDVVGERALYQSRLDDPDATRWFHAIVRGGAFLHDLGKASEHFQSMVRGASVTQLIRHEALSAVLAFEHPALRTWLRGAPWCQGDDAWLFEAAVFAAAGHHLKFHKPSQDGKKVGPLRLKGAGNSVKIHLGHPDFEATLKLGAKLGLPAPPKLSDVTWRSFNRMHDPDEDDELYGALYDEDGLLAPRGRGARWWKQRSEKQRRVFALAKAWVIAADVLGSALPKEGVSVAMWVTDALRAEPSVADLEAVVRERLGAKSLRPFQRSVASSTGCVALVEAGCGTGKTLAAYEWAKEQGRRGAGGKLFFAYPTTGTATEGFRGYVAKGDTVEATLVHSRASVDLEDLLKTGEVEADEQRLRSESLEHLRSQVIVCTVDTVLGLVQNLRRGLFLSPAISTGRFVFDEVHAYDDGMFAALLDFLRAFPRAPVLLMSASVPAGRRAAIEAVTGPLPEIERPTDVEAVPRYSLQPIAEDGVAWEVVRDYIARGKRVLWVANTVARAVAVAKRAADSTTKDGGAFPVRCYHSRYCYVHRKERHREVVDAFDDGAPAVLAVTTQVAEMSLDLSADLLVTEVAAVPALVQRLGRLNRRATPDAPGAPGVAIAIAPKGDLPYDGAEMAAGRRFWSDACERQTREARALDQRDLNALMHAVLGDAPWPPAGDTVAVSAWLEGGQVTRGGKLRDSATTAVVILEEHRGVIEAAAAKGARALKEALLRYEVPIPAKPVVWTWPRLDAAPFHPVAPSAAVSYDPRWGAAWNTVDEEERGG